MRNVSVLSRRELLRMAGAVGGLTVTSIREAGAMFFTTRSTLFSVGVKIAGIPVPARKR